LRCGHPVLDYLQKHLQHALQSVGGIIKTPSEGYLNQFDALS